jgi:catechol 2,3-dioxygenase-like lactoylglutathione lyase family enzyme
MRIDHIAYRVADRNKTAQFFIDAFNYRIADEFEIQFDDGSCAQCYALSPPERLDGTSFKAWTMFGESEYHSPPEIFVSQGSAGSIVDKWVKERNSVGGVHHIAYQVDDVEETMQDWKDKGWAEFTTDQPIVADGLSQCFTKPHMLTGVIYEFIFRTKKGFNVDSVRDLMVSTN